MISPVILFNLIMGIIGAIHPHLHLVWLVGLAEHTPAPDCRIVGGPSVLPLTKPALAAIAIFAFQNKWNQFFEPPIFINTKENLPLAVGLYFFRGMVGAGSIETTWGHLMAATTLSLLPILLVFFFAQRIFIQGIVFTGVKA